jgi:hypothetical protein
MRGIAVTVFEAFPNARESGWTIWEVKRGTAVGFSLVDTGSNISPIISDADSVSNGSPNAEDLNADMLLYIEPSELPTLIPNILLSNYYLKSPEGYWFAIESVGVGKNQHTGAIEHIELTVKQTEGIEDGE